MTERDQPRFIPTQLPEDLRASLRGQDYAGLLQESDRGTVFVLKVPNHDAEALRGAFPIGLAHELYRTPTAPVVRLVAGFHDEPEDPLVVETFVNVADQQQRREYELLAHQTELPVLVVDGSATHRFTKLVPVRNRAAIAAILAAA